MQFFYHMRFSTIVLVLLISAIADSFTTNIANMKRAVDNLITCIDPIRIPTPFKTLDPFLFCVYHYDKFPEGDDLMQAPKRGNGADFDPKAPYRMYHGDRVPGFPQHPHRGFETVSCSITGLVDHTDSCGNAGRYGFGDLQWMTAGKGVVHGEMFPLVNRNSPNTLRFFQIWLNLPAKSKMVNPDFVMHWAEEIPKYTTPDGLVKVTIWAGSLNGVRGLPPPVNSYASNPKSELAIFFINLKPGGRITIPMAEGGRNINRMAYFVEGSTVQVGRSTVDQHCALTLDASQELEFFNSDPSTTAEVLLLQGRPIGEPVAQHGPFVMNTQSEIQQAFADYRKTQFGGWPWPQDAMIFPRDKSRFALVNGTEIFPPRAEAEL